jgi:hypothetical protein
LLKALLHFVVVYAVALFAGKLGKRLLAGALIAQKGDLWRPMLRSSPSLRWQKFY